MDNWVSLALLEFSELFTQFWVTSSIAIYSSIGNFAPFYEVGVGTYLDGRKRAQWLIPLLLFTLLYNTPICTKALADIITSKIRRKKPTIGRKLNIQAMETVIL
jgi:hypothetical protein